MTRRRDSDEDAIERYDYRRGSLPVEDGLSGEVTPMRGLVSIFSENKKEGRWELPHRMRVLALFGSAKLDLRDAVVQPGLSVIETKSIFGSIEIIVPPDVIVECDGDAFLGEFSLHRSKRGPPSLPPLAGGPVIRVTGDAYVGAVKVQVKVPREKKPGRLARTFGLDD